MEGANIIKIHATPAGAIIMVIEGIVQNGVIVLDKGPIKDLDILTAFSLPFLSRVGRLDRVVEGVHAM